MSCMKHDGRCKVRKRELLALRRHVEPAEPRLATIEKVGCTCAWTTTVWTLSVVTAREWLVVPILS